MKPSLSLLCGAVLFFPASAFCADKEISNALPLRDVALFASGVGYFGRSGQIDGDARVELRVKANQISDLLKSLVLLDPKGTIKPVSYSLSDWLGNRPQETDLAIGNNFSPGALLKTFQGAQIRIEKPAGAIEGRILSVNETPFTAIPLERSMPVERPTMVEQLTLLTAIGIQTIRLDDVTSFKLLDPALDAKLTSTLEKRAAALTKRLDDGARAVALNFSGKGAREVSAGYLLDTPIWKTSYRLVLAKNQKPYLQGWAVVENTSDEDWKNVNLSLVSGRPISFIQDLAAPLYVTRPTVSPSVIGSPRPQVFGEGFEPSRADGRVDVMEKKVTDLENKTVPPPRLTVTPSIVHQSGTANYISGNAGARTRIGQGIVYDNDLAADGAKAQAQGEERGEFFEYSITGGTTLLRGEAAMVPIVATEIGGEALTIVESGLYKGPITPTSGFYLRNTSNVHLQAGPITVFSGGIYGGDALITNLSPKDSRLISYAADLELAVLQEDPETISSVSELALADGVLTVSRSHEMTRTWTFKNKSDVEKKVLLQLPDEGAWKLADPKVLEGRALGVQRFRLTCPPGEKNVSLKWVQKTQDSLAVLDKDVNTLTYYLDVKSASPALKAKLTAVVEAKRKLAELQRQRAAQEASLKAISEDQSRIRQNMSSLERSSQLYKSYEKKLGEQEERIEKIQKEVERLLAAENSSAKGLRDLVGAPKED